MHRSILQIERHIKLARVYQNPSKFHIKIYGATKKYLGIHVLLKYCKLINLMSVFEDSDYGAKSGNGARISELGTLGFLVFIGHNAK